MRDAMVFDTVMPSDISGGSELGIMALAIVEAQRSNAKTL